MEEVIPKDELVARLTRRQAVTGAVALCAFAALPAWAQEAGTGPQPGDLLVRKGDDTLTPLTVADIDPEATKTTIALPLDPATGEPRGGNLAKVMLVKLDTAELDEETAALAVEGVIAYSAICTHAACEVTTFRPSDGTVLCPCHGSRFDPKDEGKVLQGPAKAPLASLPIKIEEGKIVVAGEFSGEVGAQA
jgi:Rieske Fe-S protein